MTADYAAGWAACLQAIAAAMCAHCARGVPARRDLHGYAHPGLRDGTDFRCWAALARGAAAQHESAADVDCARGGS